MLSLSRLLLLFPRRLFSLILKRWVRREGVLPEDDVDGATSRGAAITWASGMAVISRGASAEGRNAIMCRLYATIIAKAHGAERRLNRRAAPRRRDRINRPMVGASACGTCLVFLLFSFHPSARFTWPSSLCSHIAVRTSFLRDPSSPKSLPLECPLGQRGLSLTCNNHCALVP